MSAPADDPFARFLCQVETWQRREARWKKLCGAGILFGLVMLAGVVIQFGAVCHALGRVEEATAESNKAREELAAFRKQWQDEREANKDRAISVWYTMPTPVRVNRNTHISGIIQGSQWKPEFTNMDEPAAEPQSKNTK